MEWEDSKDEEPLVGGRLTLGVVRVGDTVRRPHSPASEFTEKLLSLLEERGFLGAPRFMGRDERGRDVLNFIPGTVPVKWRRFEDEQVGQAGSLLRQFHDATRDSVLCGSAPVVCHNDAGPNNVIFQHERPIAFIDFDMAGPGEPILDIGYMAWAWCVSSKPKRQPVTLQASQVRLLAEAYGLGRADSRDLPDAIIARQRRNITFWNERREHYVEGESVSSLAKIDEVIAWSHEEVAYTIEHRATFASALS
ncbi:MAG: phosphotransferase [Myxococcota bacterium]